MWANLVVMFAGPLMLLAWLAELGRIHAPPPPPPECTCCSWSGDWPDLDDLTLELPELPLLPEFDESAFERQYLIERIGGLEAPW